MQNFSITELKKTIKGKIIIPEDAEYDKARTLFYGDIDKRPALIIQVADSTDVANAILEAKNHGMELAVRSGGHSLAGHSVCEGGIVIDLRNMKKIDFDTEGKTVWAETGLTASEVTNAADGYDLAIGFGDTGSVGIGGITLSGGVGFLARKYGLTIDNLLGAEMVNADGKLVQIDETNNPDLFWAIRGGGGNFGVITKFKYQLHELREVLGGVLILPARPEIISGFISLAENAPNELTSIVNVMPAPPMPFVPAEFQGKLSILALMMYAGTPQEGEKHIAPFRALARPIADMIKPMRYKNIFFPQEDFHPTAVGKNMFMKHVDLPTAETIINGLRSSDAIMRVVQLRVLGGAVSSIPVNATAYSHRKSAIMCNVAAFYNGPEDKQKHRNWVNELALALHQGDDGVYTGFLGNEGESRIRQAYPGQSWERLVKIKNRFDPSNLFRLNQNVPPAKSD